MPQASGLRSEGLTRLWGRGTGLEGRTDGAAACWVTPLLPATVAVIEHNTGCGSNAPPMRDDERNPVR